MAIISIWLVWLVGNLLMFKQLSENTTVITVCDYYKSSKADFLLFTILVIILSILNF